MIEEVKDDTVRGVLHLPASSALNAVVLTHGAGSNAASPLLIAVAEQLCGAGLAVLRYELPYRQLRSAGPPPRGSAPLDRAGLLKAAEWMRTRVAQRVLLGGHSYGGRQATMLAAEKPDAADGLLLLSYPLHPPRKTEQLRTEHFSALETRSLFFHGTRDPFGSPDEMRKALALIPGVTRLELLEGAGHELRGLAVSCPVADLLIEFFAMGHMLH